MKKRIIATANWLKIFPFSWRANRYSSTDNCSLVACTLFRPAIGYRAIDRDCELGTVIRAAATGSTMTATTTIDGSRGREHTVVRTPSSNEAKGIDFPDHSSRARRDCERRKRIRDEA